MIRLRRSLERGLQHPVLGPLLLVLLVVLLAFMVLHETSESIGELCVGIALVLLTAVVALPVRRFVRVVGLALATRAPPPPPETRFPPVPACPDLLPLRL